MNHKQILEQMLSFSLQQHEGKDKLIEDLQKKLSGYEATKASEVTPNDPSSSSSF